MIKKLVYQVIFFPSLYVVSPDQAQQSLELIQAEIIKEAGQADLIETSSLTQTVRSLLACKTIYCLTHVDRFCLSGVSGLMRWTPPVDTVLEHLCESEENWLNTLYNDHKFKYHCFIELHTFSIERARERMCKSLRHVVPHPIRLGLHEESEKNWETQSRRTVATSPRCFKKPSCKATVLLKVLGTCVKML